MNYEEDQENFSIRIKTMDNSEVGFNVNGSMTIQQLKVQISQVSTTIDFSLFLLFLNKHRNYRFLQILNELFFKENY
jgi:hypothetical protein